MKTIYTTLYPFSKSLNPISVFLGQFFNFFNRLYFKQSNKYLFYLILYIVLTFKLNEINLIFNESIPFKLEIIE